MSNAAHLGLQVLADVKESLGEDYYKLTDEQRLSIRDTATMLISKQIELATTDDVTKKVELQAQIEAIESTVKDWKVWGAFAIEAAFWKGVQRAAAAVGTFLASFALEVIGRIIPLPWKDEDV